MTQAVVFDLDDTLIHTIKIYNDARDMAFAHMSKLGLDITGIEQVLYDVEIINIKKYGFSKERFPRSLAKVYGALCKAQGKTYDGYQGWFIEGIGWDIYECEYPVRDGVVETLVALAEQYPDVLLILCTKGDKAVQTIKAHRSGVALYFDHIEVVDHKTIDTYIQLADKYQLTPSLCYMVGDSVKSDVNPSSYAGFNAVWVPCEEAWVHEVEEPTDRHVRLNHIGELLDLLRTPAL